MTRLLDLLAGWRGYAAAAGIALLLGAWAGWEARALLADRAELRRAQAVIWQQQDLIEDLEAEARANSAAVVAAQAAERAAAERLRALEEELSRYADQDCVAGPDLQRSLDGLR